MFACFQMYVKSTFYLFFFFFQLSYDFFWCTDMCWLSRRNHLYIPRSHPTKCVYCSAQSFCFLWKQNFLFTSFNLKEAMRLSSTHVMKMTWKQNKQSQKAFRRQSVQYSRKICLRLTVFVLNQVRVFVSGAYRHTQHAQTWLFTQKIISEEENNYFNIRHVLCFIIVNFILYFNKWTNRLRADSLSLNGTLVVREKTNTAYFYPLRKAEVSISTYVLFIPSLVRVRRPCRGLEKFFPPVLQRCYGCSFHAQEIVHTGHGMLGYNCFFLFFFWRERCLPKVSW